jgi:hypothetical protein
MGKIGGSGDERVAALFAKKHTESKLFNTSSSGLFGTKQRKLFT